MSWIQEAGGAALHCVGQGLWDIMSLILCHNSEGCKLASVSCFVLL